MFDVTPDPNHEILIHFTDALNSQQGLMKKLQQDMDDMKETLRIVPKIEKKVEAIEQKLKDDILRDDQKISQQLEEIHEKIKDLPGKKNIAFCY